MLAARTGRVAKTHTGLRTALAQLLDGRGPDRDLLTFLAHAYKYKEVGDYGVGHGAVILAADAEAQIAGAERFLMRVLAPLDETPPTKPEDSSS